MLAALRKAGWTENDLERWRKGDPRKLEIAHELRSKTTLPLAWIAQRLCMGTRGHLAWLQTKPAKPDAPSEQALLKL